MNNCISVLIPFYNSEKTIIRCLESVFKQTVKPFEIILIDDGSNDNSNEIIEEYLRLNDVIDTIVIKKVNGGVSSARNEGLKSAKGNLIALLDSDDEWVDNKLEIQLKYFTENENCDFIGGLIYSTNEKIEESSLITVNNLIFKNYFQPSTVIFKKSIIESIGLFNESQRFAEEGNYFIRIASKYNCYLIKKQLVIYDNGRRGFGISGLSSNIYEMEKGEIQNIVYAMRNNLITKKIFLIAIIYSLFKFIRRLIIVKIENYV